MFCVYFGPGYYLIKADSIGELKQRISSGEHEKLMKMDLRQSRLGVSGQYVHPIGHDLVKMEAEKAELLLPDDYTPSKPGQTVYLAAEPAVDFDAWREQMYAEARRENAAEANARAEADGCVVGRRSEDTVLN